MIAECGKQYTDKKRLEEHMLNHGGVMPFICELCGKGFARKYRYNQHMDQHLGQVSLVKLDRLESTILSSPPGTITHNYGYVGLKSIHFMPL